MFQFGLENLRRLKSVPLVDMKPITILVGRNSSGKSTFLRTFPLLRQSLLTRISSPVLWYGDFVDFGSFKEAVSDNDPEKKIIFKFAIDDISIERDRYVPFTINNRPYRLGRVNLEFNISSSNNKTRLSGIKIATKSCTYDFEIEEHGTLSRFRVNGKIVDDIISGMDLFIQSGTMLPSIAFRSREQTSPHIGYFFDRSAFLEPISTIIRQHIDGRAKEDVVERLSIDILSLNEFSDSALEQLEQRSTMRSFKKLLSDIRGANKKNTRDKFQEIFHVSQFPQIASSAFDHLQRILSGTRYIGPVRARSERYYRYQELAVSEIDSDGKNFPMFLNSLSPRQRESFSTWVKERFGYGVNVSQSIGHISINLIRGSSSSNIVDTGFGVSQVLPVLGQIWWASVGQPRRSVRNRDEANIILAIEQPELHLHPGHQALLADAIVGERGRSRDGQTTSSLQFLVETHSEAFINRIGEIIYKKRIPAEEVQILIFESDEEDDTCTNVRIATFDPNGTLENWPFGFFRPEPINN